MKQLYSVSSKAVPYICAVLLWMAPFAGHSQTSNLNFNIIPFSDPDLNRPGGGAEQWNDQNLVNIPIDGTNTRRLDKYYRFSWSMLEGAQGQYNWTRFNQEINDAIKGAALGNLKGILEVVNDKLVSSDFNHNPASSSFALDQTKVMDGNFVSILSWYDNEWGFSTRMSDTAVAWAKLI